MALSVRILENCHHFTGRVAEVAVGIERVMIDETIVAIETEILRMESRREQRRARKAAKNLVMFKTVRRRPWTDNKGVLYSSKAGVERMAQNGDDALSTAQQYKDGPKLYLHSKLRHLREPSGFVSMSRVADKLRGAP